MSHDPKLHLFISSGNSPAIVPEAFLLPHVTFGAVHVITTERPDVDLVQDFFALQDYSSTSLTISRVKDFRDFKTEQDHFNFEEVLYRWLLESNTRPEERYICLSGGFKILSTAMQKAATIFGAAEVFHVRADNCCENPDGEKVQPDTIDQVLEAEENGHLNWIRLGAEQGWPLFRQASPEDYPLCKVKTEKSVDWLSAPDHRFREWHKNIVERSQHIAGSWEELPSFPFAELATWPENHLAWLDSPLDPESDDDKEWIQALPKIELHCHLGGFATDGKQLDCVRAKAKGNIHDKLDLPEPPGWPLPKESMWPGPHGSRWRKRRCRRHLACII